MAFVALDAATGELAGIGRLSSDPDHELWPSTRCSCAPTCRATGSAGRCCSQIVDFARAEGIGRIEGFMLAENDRMLAMCREFGFGITSDPNEPGLAVARLELG